jgi:4-hydroxy-tetrahydrodipicolinate reductase
MSPINVVVNGALGKMGQQVLSAVSGEVDMRAVAGVDHAADDSTVSTPDGAVSVPLSSSLADVLDGVDVVVDFTNADGALGVIRDAAPQKVNVVVGSTGIQQDGIEEAAALANEHGAGIIIAPNFAMGAVVMTHLARIAAPFFDYADLTEMHHENKIDAPSGTALAIAQATVEGKGGAFTAPEAEKELVPGTRGGTLDGVTIHSARMPGRVAHHELVFGALGQTLTLRHDSVSRDSFMPGVLLAIREVGSRPGLTVGLDKLLGL